MLSEVIYHCQFKPYTTTAETSNVLDGVFKLSRELNLVGCSAIHEGEMVHLFQGNSEDQKLLINFFKSCESMESVTLLEWEEVGEVQYDDWQVYWEGEESFDYGQAIDKTAFLKNFVLNKNRIFTPFHQVVRSVMSGVELSYAGLNS